MSRSLALRLVLGLAGLLLLGGLLAFALSGFERLIGLWDRALAISPVVAGVYALLLVAFAAAAAGLLWWILRPPPSRRGASAPLTEAGLTERLSHRREQGLDVSDADHELAEWSRRRDAGELHIALYGQISVGKSSLIRALLPGAEVETDVRGGTTRDIHRYAWRRQGEAVTLTDVPGFSGSDSQGDDHAANEAAALARDEALRAHLVIYVCDGDLTRDQWQALTQLLEFDKPIIVAVNKADRLSADTLAVLRKRLHERLAGHARISVVPIVAGGEEEVLIEDVHGRQHRELRPRPPAVDALLEAMQTQIDREPELLNGLRDAAVLRLAAGKLDAAVDAQRVARAEELVGIYTRRAVVGALAAVSPGSDLVIQGALGTQLVRELCKLFDVAPRELQIEKLLKSANRRIRRNTALVLAVVGNGFKAFPGVGTVTGGLMHAVAYGLLFDTLGRAMVHSLRSRGELQPEATAQVFEQMLDEDLLPRARRIAALALRPAGRDASDTSDTPRQKATTSDAP